MMRWSKLPPPRNVSPLVAFTSKTPSPISRIEMSKVPPPKSNTATVCSLPRLVEAVSQSRRRRLVDDALDVEARDAAGVLGGLALGIVEVGRNRDDRFGDWSRRSSLPRSFSSSEGRARRFPEGSISRSPTLTQASPFLASTILNGATLMNSWTSFELNLRPIRRLASKTVFSGLVMAWRLAAWPTSFSPEVGEADDRRRRVGAFGSWG